MKSLLDGLNPLSYIGVTPYSPPDVILQNRPPTQQDKTNVYLGDLWIDQTACKVYVLVSLEDGIATWLQLLGIPMSAFSSLTGNVGGPVGPNNLGNINIIGAGTVLVTGDPATNTLTITDTGAGAVQFDADSGTALPAGGILNVLGGSNINTSGAGNTITVNLNEIITLANTDAGGTQGIIEFGINRFIHNRGTDNTFVGSLAGNFSLTIGSATSNSGFGQNSLQSLSTGAENTALGAECLEDLVSGSNCIGIGFLAGSAYIGAESSNIVIGNIGITGESNTIRIGTDGGGAGQQNRTFIAGIFGINPTTVNAAPVVIASDGQVGTLGTMTDGQLMIGSTGADPVLSTLTAGAGVTITNGAGSITISATGADILAYTNVNSSPYVVLSSDEFLGVDCSGGPITIQLPNAPSTGRVFMIKDRTGNANTNNITVTTVGGAVNIDGATSYVMNTQYAAVNVLFDGTAYQIW